MKETITTTGLHHVPPFMEENRDGGPWHSLLCLLTSQQRVQVLGQPAPFLLGSPRVISLGVAKAAGQGLRAKAAAALERSCLLVLVAPAGSPAPVAQVLCPGDKGPW